MLNKQLENKFGFDKLHCSNGNKEFHNFLNDTLNKGLSISEVDKLFKGKIGKHLEYLDIMIMNILY